MRDLNLLLQAQFSNFSTRAPTQFSPLLSNGWSATFSSSMNSYRPVNTSLRKQIPMATILLAVLRNTNSPNYGK